VLGMVAQRRGEAVVFLVFGLLQIEVWVSYASAVRVSIAVIIAGVLPEVRERMRRGTVGSTVKILLEHEGSGG
jgi:hypothetical protein